MKQKVLLLAILQLSFGCASMKEAWVTQNCNREAAYAQGMNHGRNQVNMKVSDYMEMCGENATMVATAYREGYQNGLKSLQTDSGTVNNSGTIINVGIGDNVQIGKPGSAANAKAWFCEVKAFMDHYEAFGPTQFETHKIVEKKCASQHHEMHCHDIECKKNL